MFSRSEAGGSPLPPRWKFFGVAGLVAAAITLPSLSVPLVGDDYMHRSYLLDHLTSRPTRGPWWNMFDTRVEVERRVQAGALPWWSSPDLRVGFLRPFATLSQYVDYILWPKHPEWMHLHNVALYLALVLVACELYRRFLAKPAAVWLAALLYAADDAHAFGTAWIASRNTLLTALFVLLCLWCYDRARSGESRRAVWLAPLSLFLGHASSEGAISAWPYLLAHAAFLDRAPLAERLRALSPLAAVSLFWLVLASALEFGAHGSGIYVDPRTEPLRFLATLPVRLPEALLAQFGAAPELGRRWPTSLFTFEKAAFSAVVIVLIGWVAVRWRRDPVVRFFALGCLGSLLPVCAVGATGRLLFISSFGAHALIAQLLVHSASLDGRAHLRALARVFAAALALASAVVCIAGAYLSPVWWTSLDAYFRAKSDALPHGKDLKDHFVVLVNTRDYLETNFITQYRYIAAKPGPKFVHLLGVSTDAVRVYRPDDFSLVLTPERGYLNDETSILVRPRDEPFVRHQEVFLFGIRIVIEEVTDDGRPGQVRVHTFDLEDPRLLWMVWDDRTTAFVKFPLPEVRQTVIIPAGPRSGPL